MPLSGSYGEVITRGEDLFVVVFKVFGDHCVGDVSGGDGEVAWRPDGFLLFELRVFLSEDS